MSCTARRGAAPNSWHFLLRLVAIFTAVAATSICFGQVATETSSQRASLDADPIAREIEKVEGEINVAIARRDRTMLEGRLADSFIHIHTDGPIESRDVFVQRLAAGTMLARQRTNDWAEFDVTLNSYDGHTAMRRSRLRFRFAQQNTETWLLELKVFVKQRGVWRLASWHGTRLHQGSIVDASTYQSLAGEYVSDAGQRLVLSWHGGGILARWPGNGVVTQIFPASETEFEDGIRKLRLTLDPERRPVRLVEIVGAEEVWRGRRI